MKNVFQLLSFTFFLFPTLWCKLICYSLLLLTRFSVPVCSSAGRRWLTTLAIRISCGSLSWISSSRRSKIWGLTCEYVASSPSTCLQTGPAPETDRESHSIALSREREREGVTLSRQVTLVKRSFWPIKDKRTGPLLRELDGETSWRGLCLILKRDGRVPSPPDSVVWLD